MPFTELPMASVQSLYENCKCNLDNNSQSKSERSLKAMFHNCTFANVAETEVRMRALSQMDP